MKYFLLLTICVLPFTRVHAQYAPQAGVPGSTAISASSSLFTGWASGCHIQRGYLYIDSPSLGFVTFGDSSMALGMADHSVVSLGDSGVADLTFPGTIYNGLGADFAVFENGFINPVNDSQAFLELAFVEVSSDGINYSRFPAQSLTQTNTQIRGSGDYMYANFIDGLAGKYGAGYGTPFDLDDLPPSVNLDKNSISHVRIIDVIGSIGSHASHDANGRIINDPYPTNFPTGGFDLDAVGVIHRMPDAGVNEIGNGTQIKLYPNPANERLFIDITGNSQGISVVLTSVTGMVMQERLPLQNKNEISLSGYPVGLYYLTIQDSNGRKWVEKIIRD